METRKAAERFHPGEYVRDELLARCWSIRYLSQQSDLNLDVLTELIHGDRGVNGAMADGLAKAFGTDAVFWRNLDAAYHAGG